jgi:hypothetical protein
MWGCSSKYPSVRSYGDAMMLYSRTKPLRGRPDFRPLDARSSRAKAQIIKQGEDYIIRLYRTDIVRFHANGDIYVSTGGWDSQATSAAIGEMSPFPCWKQKNNTVVKCGPHKFIVPSNGLLFKKTPEGYVPENPPVATRAKKRVLKAEARAAGKFFAAVPKYIKSFGALYPDDNPNPIEKFNLRALLDAGDELDDETAARIGLNSLKYEIASWTTNGAGKFTANQRVLVGPSITQFWKRVYADCGLVEEYDVELPYGEVS